MRNNFFIAAFSSTFLVLLLFLSSAVSAAEPVPGDACPSQYLIVATGGPETTGIRNLMVCNGSTWEQLTTWLANGYVGIKTATPAAPLHVNGEVIVGATTGIACGPTITGGLRWSSANGTVEMCDGTSWQRIAASTCDNSPAFPTFTDQDELAGSALVTSNIVALTGMDSVCSASIGVSGSGSPEYRVCSTSDCSSVDIDWTTNNNSADMQGKYLQLRATSSASSGTTFTITATIGPVSSNWSITTGISGCSPVGTTCSDGSVYAGLSPDGNVPMYIARCDLGQTWSGSACIGTRSGLPWNAGDDGWVDTPLVNCAGAGCDPSGETNTATLVAMDASTYPGTQDHVAARECNNLNVHGQTDWYLPSARELDVIYDNLVDAIPADSAPNPLITGFDTSGSIYWSSSESNDYLAIYQNFSDGSQWVAAKFSGSLLVRCARR